MNWISNNIVNKKKWICAPASVILYNCADSSVNVNHVYKKNCANVFFLLVNILMIYLLICKLAGNQTKQIIFPLLSFMLIQRVFVAFWLDKLSLRSVNHDFTVMFLRNMTHQGINNAHKQDLQSKIRMRHPCIYQI